MSAATLDQRVGGRSWPALIAAPLAVLVACGAAIALAAAGTHGFLVPIELHHVRSWIDGPLRTLGFAESKAVFAGEVALMGAAYLLALRVADRLDARVLWGSIVALLALFTLAPPLLSTDVASYIDYARLGAVHGIDPYVFPPNAAPHDVIYKFTRWRATRSAYGPVFTVASYPLGLLAPAVALWALKAAAGLAGLGCVALVARIARDTGRSPRFAAAALGLNPVLLIWAVGGAHNDLLMLLALLGAVALIVGRHEFEGGAALAAAIAIKATAGLALPFAVLGARPRRRWALTGVAAGAAAVGFVAYVAFGAHALNLVGILRREHRFISSESVPHQLARLMGFHVAGPVPMLLTAVLAGALAWLVWRVARGADWIAATGWAFVAFVATSTWFVAWYAIWALPFAAATRSRRLLAVTLMLQAFIVVNDLSVWIR